MATLFGRSARDTYPSLLKMARVNDAEDDGSDPGITAGLTVVQDGLGNNSPLQLSTTQVALNGLVWPTATPIQNQMLVIGANNQLVWANQIVGDLANLTTTNKSDLVAAINEINAKPSGGGSSGPTALATNFLFNSQTTYGDYAGVSNATDAPLPGTTITYILQVLRFSGTTETTQLAYAATAGRPYGWARQYVAISSTWTAWVQQSITFNDVQMLMTPGQTNVDYNTLTTPGWYQQSTNAATTNGPVADTQFFVQVVARNANDLVQTAFQTGANTPASGTSYVRTRSSGTWGVWRRVAVGYGAMFKNSGITFSSDIRTFETFDYLLNDNATITPTNIPTLAAFNTPTTMSEVVTRTFRIRQGSTARTLTWSFTGLTWITPGGVEPPAPAANKITEYILTYDSLNGWLGRVGAST